MKTPGNGMVLNAIGLTKQFGDLTAVDNLSMEIRVGEVYGFLGPNGAGKTTAINMICGLLTPTRGKVVIFGADSDQNPEIRSRIGVCPQSIILWNKLTCLEQLEFMGEIYGLKRKIAKKRSNELIERIGLTEKRNTIAQNLSGGQQRRLNIIMAMVHDPDIVVMDEPEAGLDPQSRVMARDFIRDTADQKTVILTTHNMDEAERLADRVAIIDRGKLLMVDTPDALKKTIGEGDTLKISISSEAKADIERAIRVITDRVDSIEQIDDSLIIRAKDIISRIPELSQILERNGIRILNLHLHENSLEDVFIHLTGRRLRE